MSLWNPGTIEGITPKLLMEICVRAFADHQTDEEYYCANIIPEEMPITDIFSPKGDQAFDRVSHAKWSNETFNAFGHTWKVTGYTGDWKIENEKGETDKQSETALANILNKQNGEHPDPYVAVVELAYSTRGMRAGYGVRRSGKFELWYN